MEIKDGNVIVYYSDIEKLEAMGYDPIKLFQRYGLIPKIQSWVMGEPGWYGLGRDLIEGEIISRNALRKCGL